jgi:hypothetical protein
LATMLLVAALCLSSLMPTARTTSLAFAPAPPLLLHQSRGVGVPGRGGVSKIGQRHSSAAVAPSTPLYTASSLLAGGGGVPTLSIIPNPFQQLPWNVEKEMKRKARKLRLERSALHRELGIAEDATYEEIVAATDLLIAHADGDLKRKIQIEVAKDKILQIRLNERLAGLTQASTEAKAQSSYEVVG